MQALYLMGQKKLELENRNMVKLNYYLVEEQKLKGKLLYGIQVAQEKPNHIVVEYTEPLSYSKEYVLNILHRLINHNVLVSTMLETVDDLVG
jgi:uncharacterized protein DUF6514